MSLGGSLGVGLGMGLGVSLGMSLGMSLGDSTRRLSVNGKVGGDQLGRNEKNT